MCIFGSAPKAAAVAAPKQAPKAPEVQALVSRNTSGQVAPGKVSASTLLTGPSGVKDNQLLLGKNQLLGS